MSRYKILKSILLGFTSPEEQYDVIFYPGYNTILESDGSTIWVIEDKCERRESITTANAINTWLSENAIEEIKS